MSRGKQSMTAHTSTQPNHTSEEEELSQATTNHQDVIYCIQYTGDVMQPHLKTNNLIVIR